MTPATLGYRKAASSDVAGSIHMSVARHGNRTRPVTTDSSGVLRLLQPIYLDDSGQVTYIVVNPGGAYFGEKYQYSIDVHSAAKLLVSSQSATRIHKTPVEPAVQEITFTLGAGCRMEYIPDQTIAYKNADFRQYMTVIAAPDAQGFFAEDITPGWAPDGSNFTYAGIRQRIDVRSGESGGLVCVDNVRIQPGIIGDAINGIGYLEGFTHMASILILGEHTRDDYPDRVRDIVTGFATTRVGVTSGARHGIAWLLVRALASSTDTLNNLILTVNELDRSVTTGQSRLNLRRY